jgi:Rhodopirellula transposase DDE domain
LSVSWTISAESARPIGKPKGRLADKELGKGIPYGVYDIAADAGCVSVGIDHDTAEFAVNAIGRWHETMGCDRYPTADRLMITADGGGSKALANLPADESGRWRVDRDV